MLSGGDEGTSAKIRSIRVRDGNCLFKAVLSLSSPILGGIWEEFGRELFIASRLQQCNKVVSKFFSSFFVAQLALLYI
jgi:hypothetical protein